MTPMRHYSPRNWSLRLGPLSTRGRGTAVNVTVERPIDTSRSAASQTAA